MYVYIYICVMNVMHLCNIHTYIIYCSMYRYVHICIYTYVYIHAHYIYICIYSVSVSRSVSLSLFVYTMTPVLFLLRLLPPFHYCMTIELLVLSLWYCTQYRILTNIDRYWTIINTYWPNIDQQCQKQTFLQKGMLTFWNISSEKKA